MTDPLNQTETLLDNLLETIRHIKHLNKQFSNDSFIQNILMNTDENEIQKQIKEFNIHSYSLQILTNLSYSINQFDHLQQQFQDIKNSVVSQMNEIHQQMQNKCKQLENKINIINIQHQINTFPIHFRKHSGETITLEVTNEMTVIQLKRLIHEKEGTPEIQLRFLFNGKVLSDDQKTLSEYGLWPGCSIFQILCLKGAKPVILLYDEDEIVENQEVSINLTLNEAMNIGATYPYPSFVNETNPTI